MGEDVTTVGESTRDLGGGGCSASWFWCWLLKLIHALKFIDLYTKDNQIHCMLITIKLKL